MPTSSPAPDGDPAADWDRFDSAFYLRHNYAEARKDDLRFASAAGDFFLARLRGRTGLRGVDVGSGTNLYPALTMLPFCAEIALVEYSAANRRWLEAEVPGYSPVWDPFWAELRPKDGYREIADPARLLAARARVESGSVFELPRERWELGTMFFVAESISADEADFRAALLRFLAGLVPGAPFAAAFMENSQGYLVGDLFFPAVPVTEADLRACLAGLVEDDLVLTRESPGEAPLRQGYTGMILACGRKREAPDGRRPGGRS
ncbi:SCO2525 family SAM-dependent methyltransferase [Actinocorallia populi]|uniref:SCO2525 family SAM-dependent methyltransferase n=1 Tax=Actinocorallia populi TaxID=2079200 RepID=UPI000D0867FE|nr:SCO2525 family SAM-dependent methyltransferase [Actinocorallia populi]